MMKASAVKNLKPSRLNQAKKELSELDESLVLKLKEAIPLTDAKHYHVILVRIKNRPSEIKNVVSFIIQTYNERAYKKLKKSYLHQGFTQLILLHDPKLDTVEAEDVESEKDKEIEELKAKLAEKEAKGPEVEIENNIFDVDKASFKELGEYAQANNIDLKGNKSTVDMRAFLKNYLLNK